MSAGRPVALRIGGRQRQHFFLNRVAADLARERAEAARVGPRAVVDLAAAVGGGRDPGQRHHIADVGFVHAEVDAVRVRIAEAIRGRLRPARGLRASATSVIILPTHSGFALKLAIMIGRGSSMALGDDRPEPLRSASGSFKRFGGGRARRLRVLRPGRSMAMIDVEEAVYGYWSAVILRPSAAGLLDDAGSGADLAPIAASCWP